MNITRLGFIFLIVGAILLLNAWSEHVPHNMIHGSVAINVTETDGYVMFMPPVGEGNLTVGFRRYADTGAPSPPGFVDNIVASVHIRVDDPANRTIIEEDIVTPDFFDVDFNLRGLYKVYLINNGNETAEIPIGLRFKPYNAENREADKFFFSLILIGLGALFVAVGIVMKFVLGRSRQQ